MTEDFCCDQVLSGRAVVNRVRETTNVLAFDHTRPFWPVHIVVIPKRLLMLKRTRWKWLLIFSLIAAAVVLGLVDWYPSPKATLTDLKEIEELRARFNKDKGMPRIVLLLSPT